MHKNEIMLKVNISVCETLFACSYVQINTKIGHGIYKFRVAKFKGLELSRPMSDFIGFSFRSNNWQIVIIHLTTGRTT